MPPIKCFWLEATDRARRGLRRYRVSDVSVPECPGPLKYHEAENPLDEVPALFEEHEGRRQLSYTLSYVGDEFEVDDWRWPKHCEVCDYGFADDDPRQVNIHLLYRRTDTSELLTLDEAPVGAMWDAWWLDACWRGPDGICLVIRTPAGDWLVDPDGTRRGDPRTGLITVDRNRTPSYSAGRGSIRIRGYHAYLRDGYLEDA